MGENVGFFNCAIGEMVPGEALESLSMEVFGTQRVTVLGRQLQVTPGEQGSVPIPRAPCRAQRVLTWEHGVPAVLVLPRCSRNARALACCRNALAQAGYWCFVYLEQMLKPAQGSCGSCSGSTSLEQPVHTLASPEPGWSPWQHCIHCIPWGSVSPRWAAPPGAECCVQGLEH